MLRKLIPASVKDAAMRTSSTRIQSYLIVPLIYIFALFTVVSEGVMLFHAMQADKDHSLSSQFLTVFISILTHHLALLGINKNSKSEPRYSDFANSTEAKTPEAKKIKAIEEKEIITFEENSKNNDENKADPEEGMI